MQQNKNNITEDGKPSHNPATNQGAIAPTAPQEITESDGAKSPQAAAAVAKQPTPTHFSKQSGKKGG